MTQLVNSSEIEKIVGVQRHPTEHYARADSSKKTVYILHSKKCVDSDIDLRDCPFSLILDRGINEKDWDGRLDQPVIAGSSKGRLVPVSDGEWGLG